MQFPFEAATARPHEEGGGDALLLMDGFRLVRHGDELMVPVGGQRLIAFLGLAGTRNRTVTAASLWPDSSEQHAHGRLRTALWRLQRLWPGLVSANEHQLQLSPGVAVDTRHFVQWALGVIRGGPHMCSVDSVFGALTSGELLPGWYDEWVLFERERLRQLRSHALEELSAQLVRQQRFALAMEAALEAVRTEPLRESAHRAVIAVHLAEGNYADARNQYLQLRRLLRAELDVEPTLRLAALTPPRDGRAGRGLPAPAQAR
jgi:DNA-binding SARP family transcriptional activator